MIVKPLTPTLCKVGESVKIETVITGKPKPALEWTFNGQKLDVTEGVKISEKDDIYTLIIDNVKQAHDGDYTLKAENALGSVQTSANLTVEADKVIEFVKPLEDVEIKEKDVIQIDVELSTDEVPNVKWYKDGDAIDATDDKKYEIKRQGRKHSLVIKNATVHHEGEYTAAVGEQECSCELTVVELPPEFTKKIQPVNATVGEEKAVFEIELSKGDAITKWFKNGQEVELSGRVQSKIDGTKIRNF
jgi:ribosomal protein L12E/L44/L45/RPP1/RPP2